MRIKFLITLVALLQLGICHAQTQKLDTLKNREFKRYNYKPLIVPAALITYGFIGMDNDAFKALKEDVSNETLVNIDRKTTLDDFSQYVPALSVYALNLGGIKGKSDFKTRTTILATSYMIMGSTVIGLKSLTKIERPDGSSFTSFPSGHTATAFMGAEFLRQEYKDISVWYGVTGYVLAAGTGIFRIVNNRHWVTDVMTGAGIGILSTKIAYWVNPFLMKILFKQQNEYNMAAIAPFYNGEQAGLGLVMKF